MVRDEGGRWDVSTEEDEVYVERISDGEQEFEDFLSPDEARALAGLLTRYAAEAEKWVDEDEVDAVVYWEDSDDSD
jgi:hypothetical protein